MPKTKKNKTKKTSAQKKRISKVLVFFALFVLVALCFGAYLGARLVITNFSREAGIGASNEPTPSPSTESTVSFPDADDLSDSFSVTLSTPTVIGTKRAVICAELNSDKSDAGTYGFLVRDTLHNTGFELTAESSGNIIYARTDALKPNTDYLIAAYTIENNEKLYARDMMAFSTPNQILTTDQVDDILANEFPDVSEETIEEKRLAYETEACLSLLGFDVGEFGEYDFETKSAIMMLEYSFTSVNHLCDWSLISGVFTEPFLATLKDILTVTPITDKKTVLRPFVISRYSLTTYASYAETGASINCDQLVLDALKQDEGASAAFSEFPFVVDSAEFQEKYAGLINGELDDNELSNLISLYGKDTLNEPLEVALAAIAAKNKVYFSDAEADWLSGLSGDLESTFTLFGSENTQTAFTLLLPAALAFCYMNDDYKTRTGAALPVTLTLRNTPKSWTAYCGSYGKNEVLKFSALWHLTRQQTKAVPGFCLNEYLVSVDFAPADDTILSTEIYNYLYIRAAEYGFYPDTVHPYRWIYLGIALSDETLALSLAPEPLEN